MMEFVRSSALANKPQLPAALSVADGGLYVSKGDATRIANAIQSATRQ